MTSDYVDAVLFQLRWEAFEDLDGYFMGSDDTPNPSNDEFDDAKLLGAYFASDAACQTPKEWLSSEPPQERKDEARSRAEPRNRTAEPDGALEKKPKADPNRWSEPGSADANMSDILFWALLLCVTHVGNVAGLEQWARKAVEEEKDAEEQKAAWKPTGTRQGKCQVAAIFEPLAHAHKGVEWQQGALDDVGLAMQACWRGEGRVDGLTGSLLKDYIANPRQGARVTKKDLPPPRYRTWAVVRVARLVLKYGSQLRVLLRLDSEMEEAKPSHIVMTEQSERIRSLEKKVAEQTTAARRLQDAWRHAASRLKTKTKAVTEARRDERSKAKSAAKASVKEEKVQLKRKYEEAKAGLRGELDAEYAERLSAARARARKVLEKKAAVSETRCKRIRELEDNLEDAVQQLEELYGEEAEEEAEAKRHAEIEALAKVRAMPTWQPRGAAAGAYTTLTIDAPSTIYTATVLPGHQSVPTSSQL